MSDYSFSIINRVWYKIKLISVTSKMFLRWCPSDTWMDVSGGHYLKNSLSIETANHFLFCKCFQSWWQRKSCKWYDRSILKLLRHSQHANKNILKRMQSTFRPSLFHLALLNENMILLLKVTISLVNFTEINRKSTTYKPVLGLTYIFTETDTCI